MDTNEAHAKGTVGSFYESGFLSLTDLRSVDKLSKEGAQSRSRSKLRKLLRDCRSRVTIFIKLAASGINPIQVQQIHQISQYYEPLMTFMKSLPQKEKVIIVGHSIGGVSTSVAMEKFPRKISVAVFVTAYVLSQNLTYSTIRQEEAIRITNLMDSKLFFFDGPDKPATARLLGTKFLASRLYQLSPPEDLTLALTLVRPDPLYNDVELLKIETAVTNDRNGRVPKIFIISKSDKLITEDFQKWIIERSGPFAEVKVIKDSDHMVMFSKPKNLSSILLEIAQKY